MSRQKTFADVLTEWATEVPSEMKHETTRDKLLDSFLRLFENLSAAKITQLPPRRELARMIGRAMCWQWTALNIQTPPIISIMAPHILSLAIIRWLMIWKTNKTPTNSRLMATIDRDLERVFAAAQYR